MDDLPIQIRGKNGRKRRRGGWVVLLLLAGLAVFGYRWRMHASDGANDAGAGREGRRGGDPAARAVPVVAAQAIKGDVAVFLRGLGTVTPENTVVVRPRVDGQLLRVLFREGQIVKAGDLLAEIDPQPFQMQIAEVQGQTARDEALLQNAKADLARYGKLVGQLAIATQQVDTQKALVRQYEATLKVDAAQLESAKLQLSYTQVTAPIGGRVGFRQLDAGNIVRASDPNGLVVITQVQPIAVVFSIPQDDLPAVMRRLLAGDTLPVEAYDRSGRTLLATGTLLTADNQIDLATGTVKLKAEFGNENNALFPNQFVNVKMQVDTVRDTTVMPTAGLQRGTQGTFVYVVQSDSTVTVRPVTIGPIEGEKLAVQSGLAPGETVVVDGADKLREGAKVTLPGAETTAEPSPGQGHKDEAQQGDGQQGKEKGAGHGEGRRHRTPQPGSGA
jgi:membrane fusion protein, multidrug efflux system